MAERAGLSSLILAGSVPGLPSRSRLIGMPALSSGGMTMWLVFGFRRSTFTVVFLRSAPRRLSRAVPYRGGVDPGAERLGGAGLDYLESFVHLGTLGMVCDHRFLFGRHLKSAGRGVTLWAEGLSSAMGRAMDYMAVLILYRWNDSQTFWLRRTTKVGGSG